MANYSTAELPPNILRCMCAEDRKSLGVQTLAEVQAAYEQATEGQLQRLCESELSRRGIVFLHLSFRAREKIGWPDLTFCLEGRPMAVELKSASGRLSPEQEALLGRMKANGWQTHVVRDFDAFRTLLDAGVRKIEGTF